jgi:glycosyltransferase involved in cell wall biosynthesis
MIYLISAIGITTVLYTVLIYRFRCGWKRLPEINTLHRTSGQVFISLIVPFRNEQNNITHLVQNITRQRFSPDHLEVVMVDDHSSDNGPEVLEALQKKNHWLKIVSSHGHGKKEALRKGISSATGELIVTTDADCRFGKDWLQTIAETYLKFNPDMIVMPVSMDNGKSLLDKFQQTDYLSLQMATAGAFGIDKPIISSGANLAFKKKSFLETSHSVPGKSFLSGDDVFLLHAFKHHAFKIIYLKSAQAIVNTSPARNFGQFISQRMRWGGKSRGYNDLFAWLTALLIFITNSALAIFPALALLNTSYIWVWIAAILIKATADWHLLKAGKTFFAVTLRPMQFLFFSLVYPYYVLIAGTGSLFFKERWKDRRGR